MPRLACPRRASLLALAVLFAAVASACGTSQVAPTGEPSSAGASAASSAEPSGAASPASTASTEPGRSPGSSSAAGASPGSPDEPDSPPPAGDPQEADACVAIVPSADVEAAISLPIGDVTAIGTDPAISLTCTYSTADGASVVISTNAGDATGSFQSSFDLATSYGQDPVMLDGLGDQAYYAKAADRWAEQVVVAKGPVILRITNGTPATIGQEAFAALAASAAEAIRAEIPPAP